VRLSKLTLTDAIKARLAIVDAGERAVNADGCGSPLSYSGLDALKLEFANEVLAEIARQQMARDARVDQLEDLPMPEPVAVVDVGRHRKMRRRRA